MSSRAINPARGRLGGAVWWAFVLVGSVHLLTISGEWNVTDHGEMLHMARRILTRGTFDLRSPGERLSGLPHWPSPSSRSPQRSRFVPGTPLTMVPLLALDQAFGWSDWENFGRIIHLHGELFVLGALVLVAWSVRAGGGSAHAAAAAVVLAGFSWPFWMIARRAGPEPVVAFLVALFVAGQIGAPKTTGGGANAASRAAWVRGLVCAVLPWVHATGPVVAVALVVAEALVAWRAAGSEPGRVRRTLLACTPVLLGVTLGLLSWLWLWNYLYHGSWWGGGYAQYRGDRFFRLHNPLIGFWRYGRDAAVQTPLLFLIAVLGWRKVARSAITDVALFLAAALIVFFSPFSSEEPARRLSPIVPALAVVVGLAWDRLRWSPIAARLLLAISIPIGDFWLFRLESFAPTRWGDFPPILWIRLADQGAPSWLTVVPVLVLIAVALFAIDRLNTSLRAGAMPDSN